MSRLVISSCFVSSQLISSHLISSHLIACHIIMQAVEAGVDTVVAVGGDGTLTEVSGGIHAGGGGEQRHLQASTLSHNVRECTTCTSHLNSGMDPSSCFTYPSLSPSLPQPPLSHPSLSRRCSTDSLLTGSPCCPGHLSEKLLSWAAGQQMLTCQLRSPALCPFSSRRPLSGCAMDACCAAHKPAPPCVFKRRLKSVHLRPCFPHTACARLACGVVADGMGIEHGPSAHEGYLTWAQFRV